MKTAFREILTEYARWRGSLTLSFFLISLLGVAMWFMWLNYADHTIVSVTSLQITTGLIVLNCALALWSLRRETFASYLLLGATIAVEVLAIAFLYLV